MCHDGSNGGRGLPDAPMVLALTRYRGYHRAWPLLVVIAVYASLAVEAVAQDGVATDRAALEALYDATGGQGWTDSTNWNTAAPIGEWFGVTTDAAGRVTRLELPGNGLKGPIPDTLENLVNLGVLYLGDNALTGPIPSELGRLVNLEWLGLWGNELTGPVPAWLGNLTGLRELHLGGNALTGPIPSELGRLVNLEELGLWDNELTGPVPAWLGNLTGLQSLYLGGNALTGPIPSELGRLVNLERLSLWGNELTGPVPAWLGNLTGLRELHLGGNALTGPIPAWLGNLTGLRELHLGGNALTGPIPSELGRLVNLERLSLRGNELTGPVPAWLGNLTGLQSLYLGDNALTGPIPSELGRLVNLERLSLWGNELTGPVPAELGNLANIESLVLSWNPLSGTLPQRLTQLARLTELDISNTGLCAPADTEFQEWLAAINFSGATCNRPPQSVDAIPAQALTESGPALGVSMEAYFSDPDDDPLTYAAASSNAGAVTAFASGDTVWLVPGAAGTARVTVTAQDPDGLSATQAMTVTTAASAGPQSDREVLEVFYESTGGASWRDSTNWNTSAPLGEWHGVTTDPAGRVTWLDLNENGLTGLIPPVLEYLASLRGLYLGGNALTGPIPSELERLVNLEELGLWDNELTGPVPAWLGNLTGLRELRLGGNALTSPIPSELERLVNLEELGLWDNELTGPVPAWLGNMTGLRELRLGGNALTSPIPSELERLVNLEELGLWDNELTGPVPAWLGNMTGLQSLYLGGNALTGPIPSELGRLVNLEWLSLGGNGLTGPIPLALGRLSNLRRLYFWHSWGLSGPLPGGLESSSLEELGIFATQTCAPTAWGDWLDTIEFVGRLCEGEPEVTIDVAVVYTQAAREEAGGTAEIEAVIDLMVAETNEAYQASGVYHRLALVARSEVQYAEAGDFRDIGRLADPSDGYMDEVHAMRDRTGADLVHLVFKRQDHPFGGVAHLGGAFGLTCQHCGGDTFAHELGHNMGLRHDRYAQLYSEIGRGPVTLDPAFGYVNQQAFGGGGGRTSRWRTIMAYPTQCADAYIRCERVFRFSNPRQRYNGDPLGIPFGEGSGVTGPADAAAVLNATGPAVALWRDRPPPEPESFSISNLGGWSITSSGDAETVRAGYGRIRADAASTTPSGIAIFQFRNSDGVLVSEAGVPAAQLVSNGRIFAEVNGPANTGLAIANPNEVPATIRFHVTDGDGVDSGHDSFQLGAGQQTAKLLDWEPFHISGPFVGTFTFTSSAPVAVIALRGLTNEANEWLMTTLPVAPLSAAVSDTVYFPHFADGGGWATELVLVNPTDLTIAGTVGFLGPGSDTTAGAPVVLTLDDGSAGAEFDYTIAPRSFRRFTTSNRLGEVKSGSVRATPDAGSAAPSGLVIFSYATAEKTLAEAGVPVSPEGTAFRVPVDAFGTPNQPGSIRTGLAVANTADVFNTVTLEVTRRDGTLAASPATLTLPPSGQAARMLDDILTLPADFSGLLRVSSVFDVSVIALRVRINELGELKVTTTTPSNETAVATSEDRFFAHFADSGGWTTEFILFSGTAGQPASGTLSFFGDAGQPLDLTGAQPCAALSSRALPPAHRCFRDGASRAVAIGGDHKATIRAEAALETWSQRAGKQSSQQEDGLSRNDPDVKEEIQSIENAVLTGETDIIAKYGGLQGVSERLSYLKNLPKSSSTIGVTIDGFETWVSDRLSAEETV